MDNRPASSGEREFSHATISSAMGRSTAPVARIFCNRRVSLSARVWMTVGDIAQIKALHAQRSLLGGKEAGSKALTAASMTSQSSCKGVQDD
jgi:hypothetical protein